MEQVYQFAPDQIATFLDGAAYALIVCGLLVLFRPGWPVLIPLLIWQILNVSCSSLYGDAPQDWLQPALAAPQYVAPLALIFVDLWPPSIKTTLVMARSAVGLLILAATVSFATQGYLLLACRTAPSEINRLAQFSAEQLEQDPLSDAQIMLFVRLLGALDIAGALALLTSRNKAGAALLTCWGFLSTMLFALVHRQQGYHITLAQAGNWGAPLVALQFWLLTVQEGEVKYLPEEHVTEE